MPEDIAERFARDTATHELTVLRDDGMYRHLKFRGVAKLKDGSTSPSSFYWFDLITWPGNLVVNGDCGSYHLARIPDMFEFFRGHDINPQYWAEKVRAGKTSRYSQDRFRRLVTESAADSEADYAGLAEAVEERIFGEFAEWKTEYEDSAREALRDFEHGESFKADCTICREHASGLTRELADCWRSLHVGTGHAATITRVEGFNFDAAGCWEWDLQDHDWQFLWCCHAIVLGIRQYDQRPAEPAREMAASNA